MNTTPDLEGIKLGRLEALAVCGRGQHGVVWLCECECKALFFAYSGHILSGKSRSCVACCRMKLDRKPVKEIEGRPRLMRNEYGYYEAYAPKPRTKRRGAAQPKLHENQRPFSFRKEIAAQRQRLAWSITVGDRVKYKVAGGLGQASGVVIAKSETSVVVGIKHGAGRRVVANHLIVCKVQNG
jgi:hypothetical protein